MTKRKSSSRNTNLVPCSPSSFWLFSHFCTQITENYRFSTATNDGWILSKARHPRSRGIFILLVFSIFLPSLFSPFRFLSSGATTMSSAIRESGRALAEATCHGIVRRMVSLPRSIIGGVSRVMGHGIDLMGIGGRRNQHLLQPNFQLPHPQQPEMVPEEWAFLTSFEQQYGSSHPFFYVCRFTDALKMAEDDHKFLFMYLHSPQHPFTYSFCSETLCSELVTQFLDANFVSWGALADRGEGLHMAATLKPGSFPFCAVVAPASGDSLAVLQQVGWKWGFCALIPSS